MKKLKTLSETIQYLDEQINNLGLNTKAKNPSKINESNSYFELKKYIEKHKYPNNFFFHISWNKINKILDNPMFVYKNMKDIYGCILNMKEDGIKKYYVYKILIDSSNVLNIKDTYSKIDNGLICDLLSNPSKKELKKIVSNIEKENKCEGITLIDYSPFNPEKETKSILIFHPSISIKDFSLIDYQNKN